MAGRSASNETRVGRRELTSMLTIFVVAHAFLNYPAMASAATMESAWMQPLLSGILALLAFLVSDFLFRRFFPSMDLLEVVRVTFGKFVSQLFTVAFAAYFLWVTSSIMRQFAETVITTVLPKTPILLVAGIFLATVCFVASYGIEAIVRVAQLTFPVVALGVVSLVVLTINWWHPALLLPFWGQGVSSVVYSSIQNSSIFLNVLLICLIYPHAQDYRDLRRVGLWSTVTAAILLSAFMLGYHMVFAPEETAKLASPMYSMARLIHFGRFIQRVESVYIFIWVAAAVVKMSITLWVSAYILTSAFNWPTFRPIIPALGLFCFAGSLFESDVAAVNRGEELTLMTWGWVVCFVLPVVILGIGAILTRGKWRTARHA